MCVFILFGQISLAQALMINTYAEYKYDGIKVTDSNSGSSGVVGSYVMNRSELYERSGTARAVGREDRTVAAGGAVLNGLNPRSWESVDFHCPNLMDRYLYCTFQR